MPNRVITVTIVLFWLATMAWFVRREITPRWFADAPPPFSIELVDEAVRQSLPVRWLLPRNGQVIAPARTAIEYNDVDDTFTLTCTIYKFELFKVEPATIYVEGYRNQYRVTRTGELRAAETDVRLSVGSSLIEVLVAADVRGNQIVPRCRVISPWGNLVPKLDPITLTHSGVLNPMHPVHRIHGLRSGQRWRVPVWDPLADAQREALQSLFRQFVGTQLPKLPSAENKVLLAEVSGPRPMLWDNLEQECFVIEYRGDELVGRTWVRRADGAVLRQEAFGAGEELVLQREP
jgi:hypothetical protein